MLWSHIHKISQTTPIIIYHYLMCRSHRRDSSAVCEDQPGPPPPEARRHRFLDHPADVASKKHTWFPDLFQICSRFVPDHIHLWSIYDLLCTLMPAEMETFCVQVFVDAPRSPGNQKASGSPPLPRFVWCQRKNWGMLWSNRTNHFKSMVKICENHMKTMTRTWLVYD